MQLSIVVVAHEMERELPRTLATLTRTYQRGDADYEVIVVDNGSPTPVESGLLDTVPGGRLLRLDPAPGSPARAANVGIEASSGTLVGVLIDGARMVTPGLTRSAVRAASLGERVVAAAPAYHLGDEPQMQAVANGYDQAVEDRLLETVDWRADGDELFTISCLAASSARGWFGPMGESNALFMARALWNELAGFDEVFDRPGGGLVNHDLFRRACEAPGIELVHLLGEGTFHQFHGGAATGGKASHDELWGEYEAIRGRPFTPPDAPPTFLGAVPAQAIDHLESSVAWLRAQNPRHTGCSDRA